MDINLFLDILKIESTSGSERRLANFISTKLKGKDCQITHIPEDAKEDAPINLLISWGCPRVIFCTHLDTVPPYIAPSIEEIDGAMIIKGRGSCDAKGQIFSMLTACQELAQEGCSDFGLLLLYGEETGSYGAKKMNSYPSRVCGGRRAYGQSYGICKQRHKSF